jgi:transposase
MIHFVGLDISQKITASCVVGNAGRGLWRGQRLTATEQIAAMVRRHAEDDSRIGIETGAMTPWLVHELHALGLQIICFCARHTRAALMMRNNKAALARSFPAP